MSEGDRNKVKELIEALALAPHPEGGWYRETWRAEAPDGERASATSILFLLGASAKSLAQRRRVRNLVVARR